MPEARRQLEARHPDPPGREDGGAADTESVLLHLLMGTLQVDALHALIGTGRTQAVAANVIGSGICPGVYQAVAQNLGWLLDLCDQACLREP